MNEKYDVNEMLSEIHQLKISDAIALRRAYGLSFASAPLSAKIAFAKVNDEFNDTREREIAFFIATSYANYRNGAGAKKDKVVKAYDFLRAINRSSDLSDSAKSRINRLLATDFDETGCFHKQFKVLVQLSKENPNFDYVSLYYDLKYWDEPCGRELKYDNPRTVWSQKIFRKSKKEC